jgi:hypothetical protein
VGGSKGRKTAGTSVSGIGSDEEVNTLGTGSPRIGGGSISSPRMMSGGGGTTSTTANGNGTGGGKSS